MTILVVEPSATTRRLISNTLIRAGLPAIEEAASGEEALDVAERAYPLVVILGYDLGDMRGIELTARLRKISRHSQTPVLLVSERCTHEDVLYAVEAGVDHYVLIPFESDGFLQKVRAAIQKATHHAADHAARVIPLKKRYISRRMR
ncbi:MAG: hypothetical protein KatS3mg043_0837 [Rhodothermaceae bacterium]|nr:MAG: hypothetical protein KatS3mg043_0837 [Rhodothermaceae bacterium]